MPRLNDTMIDDDFAVVEMVERTNVGIEGTLWVEIEKEYKAEKLDFGGRK